ncbi:hypothetical protein, partial [Rhizobium sp. RU20A]|uniref:hypothetical protein n=1 Tax=Rhizobium sp. RU20A TaxID=1907412 RepID=UPI001AEE5FB5
MAANKRKSRPAGPVEHCSPSVGPSSSTLRARSILRLRTSERFENDAHFLHLPSYPDAKLTLQNTYPDRVLTL